LSVGFRVVCDITPAGRSGAINLLPLIDPARDIVAGNWVIKDDELLTDSSHASRMQVPYRPPLEYDLRVAFTRTEGADGVGIILVGNGRQFACILGGSENTLACFHMVDGKQDNENRTSVKRDAWLTTGRRHAALIQVRKDGVRALFDGLEATQLKTDYRNVGLPPELSLKDAAVLAVGANKSPTTFHRLEVVEISGPGTFPRPDDPAAKKAAESRKGGRSYPWQLLCNGRDLNGWVRANKQPGKAEAVVQDGKASLRLTPPIYLATPSFGDYHLRFEYKAENGAGGGIQHFGSDAGQMTLTLENLNGPKPALALRGKNFTWQQAEVRQGRLVGIAKAPGPQSSVTFSPVGTNPNTPWQRVEVVRLGDAFVYLVNGRIAGAVMQVRHFDNGEENVPGPSRIIFWTIASPAEFRNIELREITTLPPEVLEMGGR
jgi:hypothetical protein